MREVSSAAHISFSDIGKIIRRIDGYGQVAHSTQSTIR